MCQMQEDPSLRLDEGLTLKLPILENHPKTEKPHLLMLVVLQGGFRGLDLIGGL